MRSPARNAVPAAAPAAAVEPLFDNQAVSSARALPLYMQLAQHLRQLIIGGAINDRDALPAERDLAERFRVSRVTVRKALQSLTDEGLLQQRQGAGTFVSAPPRVEQPLSVLTSFTEDMQSRGLTAGSVWLDRATGTASSDEALILGLSLGERVSRLRRIRLANGVPMAIEHCVVPSRFLPDPGAVSGSLYDVLRARGHIPHRALQRLSATSLTDDQARLLDTQPGSPALHIERRTFLPTGGMVELVRSSYRGDAYDFVVELQLSAPSIPSRHDSEAGS